MSSRTDSHTISVAEDIFTGDAYHAGAHGGGRGLLVLQLAEADLGTPVFGDVDGYVTAAGSGNNAAAGDVPLDGALSGVADVARGIVIDSTSASDTTQVIKVTGTDIYGAPLVEEITINGTTAVGGKKAFKTVTAINNNTAIFVGNLTVGTTDILGLPYAIADAGDLYVGNENNVNAVPAAGTLVAAVTSAATATTGDVRGTYNPNTALDGSKPIKLVYKPAGRKTTTGYGVPQYTG